MKEIRLFETFAGYGGASFALKKAKIPFKCIGFSEINKFAIQCYNQNHKNIHNYNDITKIKLLPDFDLLTGGFPCQPFSAAGLGKGELDIRGTLFWEIARIAKIKQPKYMLLENVKGITFQKYRATFDKILATLDEIGYNVVKRYDTKKRRWLTPILNSADYGIPQSRVRVWFICFRKDLEQEFRNFQLPKKEPLKLLIKDLLEKQVDDKYFLNETQMNRLLTNERHLKDILITGNVSQTLSARDYKDDEKRAVLPIIKPDKEKVYQDDRRIKQEEEPTFTVPTNNRHSIIQLNNPKHSNDRIYDSKGISPTLSTMQGGNQQPFVVTQLKDKMIRKLTPKECFRLMGFVNDEINLKDISNSQQYKLAGNGWEINVVSKILKNMLIDGKKMKNKKSIEEKIVKDYLDTDINKDSVQKNN